MIEENDNQVLVRSSRDSKALGPPGKYVGAATDFDMFALAVDRRPLRLEARTVAAALLPRGETRVASEIESHATGVCALPRAWNTGRFEAFHCRESAALAMAWARLDGVPELAEAVGVVARHPASDTPRLILRAFQKWDVDAPAHLRGEFAFAIYDSRARRLFAARDPLGIRPLYWWHDANDSERCVVATSIPGLIAASGRDFEIRPEWVARFVANVSMSCEATPYAGIKKIPPAHWLDVRNGSATLSRYHGFTDKAALVPDSADEIIERYRDMLRKSVRSRLAVHDINGIETSGGLDSSTIVGFAMEGSQGATRSVHGFGFANHEGEAEAILSVSQATGLGNNHIFCSRRDPMEDALVWDILGHPAEHGNAVAHHPFYCLAERLRVRSLLSGFGGDEGVTNYAPNFQRELIKRRRYLQLWNAGGPTVRRRLRYIASAIYRANRPGGYAESIMHTVSDRLGLLPLRSEVVDGFGISEQIVRDSQYDWPIPKVSGFSIHMLRQPFVSTRTESCSLVAANFGIEYFWPLLDPELIAFFLATPTEMKVHDGVGRALHRAAVDGIVPDVRRLAKGKYIGEFVKPMPGFSPDDLASRDTGVADGPLHAMLVDMLDQDRLDRLLEQCRPRADGGANMRARRTARSIGDLDRWLRLRR